MESNSQFLTNQQIEKRIEAAAKFIHQQNEVRAPIIEKIAEKKVNGTAPVTAHEN